MPKFNGRKDLRVFGNYCLVIEWAFCWDSLCQMGRLG